MSEAEDTVPTIEEALEEAFNEIEQEEKEEDTGDAEDAVEGKAPTEDADGDDVDPDEDEEEPEYDDAASADDDASDEGEGEEDAEEVDDSTAPAAWRALARESWKDVPKAARDEITRMHTEFEKKLGEQSAEVNQARQFAQAIEPFQQTIAIEAGGDAIAATRNLMNVATRLRQGTPQEKAMVARDIIMQYGVDLETLDGVLAQSLGGESGGAPVGYPQQQPQAPADPRVEQMWQQMQAQQTHQQQSFQAEIDAFMSDPKNEFAQDVRNTMADLIDISDRRGESMTLQEAYDKACMMDSQVQQVLQQRQAAPVNDGKSLKRKKRAAKTISGSPSSTSDPEQPQTLAGALNAAWDSQVAGE